jgi:hypothetical protein
MISEGSISITRTRNRERVGYPIQARERGRFFDYILA